jgi:pimeloyl-ACP methyl ester carboxylesterase
MQPKSVTANNISIAYVEKKPDAANTVFFIHGSSSSAKIWAPQFSSPLFNNYRLIAFDLPAHGESSTFEGTNNDYSLPGIAAVVAEAVNQLSPAGKFILAGLSLGTNIVAEMLPHTRQASGTVIIGSCMVGAGYEMDKAFMPGIDLHAAFIENATEEELNDYWHLASASVADKKKFQFFAEDYYAVKDNFRSKMFATVGDGRMSDQVKLLAESKLPSLVVFGHDELVCNKAYLDNSGINLWQNKVFIIPRAGHLVPMDKPEELNWLISDFANDIFKKKDA